MQAAGDRYHFAPVEILRIAVVLFIVARLWARFDRRP